MLSNKLLEIADLLMLYYRPCKIEGSKCLAGDPNPCCQHSYFNSGVCPFYKEGLCANKNLACKAWFCETALNQMDSKCKESFYLIEKIAKIYELYGKPYLGEPYVGADKNNDRHS